MSVLERLIDRAELTDLVSRTGGWLDRGGVDDPDVVFADDITVETPAGIARGTEEAVAMARAHRQDIDSVTHITDHLIDLDGDVATVRANTTITFSNAGAIGGRYVFRAVRTASGWRLTAIGMTPVWMQGIDLDH